MFENMIDFFKYFNSNIFRAARANRFDRVYLITKISRELLKVRIANRVGVFGLFMVIIYSLFFI